MLRDEGDETAPLSSMKQIIRDYGTIYYFNIFVKLRKGREILFY